MTGFTKILPDFQEYTSEQDSHIYSITEGIPTDTAYRAHGSSPLPQTNGSYLASFSS